MAEINPPLYLDVNNAYSADELGLPYRDQMGEGVLGATDLLVSAGGGLNSSTAAGAAWVKGDDNADAQPTYRVRSDSAVVLAHAAADPTNPRIDLVIAEVLDAGFSGVSRLWRLRVITGTPAGSPVPPALPNNAIALSQVRINAASGTITSVTDVRQRAIVGGGKAGGFAPFFDQILAVDTASFDVPNIPPGGSALKLVLSGRGTAALTEVLVYMKLNNDGTAVYTSQQLRGNGAVANAGEDLANPLGAFVGMVPAASSTAGHASSAEIMIPNYDRATFFKNWTSLAGISEALTTGKIFAETRAGVWANAAIVNRVTLTPSSGLFKAGTRLTVLIVPGLVP